MRSNLICVDSTLLHPFLLHAIPIHVSSTMSSLSLTAASNHLVVLVFLFRVYFLFYAIPSLIFSCSESIVCSCPSVLISDARLSCPIQSSPIPFLSWYFYSSTDCYQILPAEFIYYTVTHAQTYIYFSEVTSFYVCRASWGCPLTNQVPLLKSTRFQLRFLTLTQRPACRQ